MGDPHVRSQLLGSRVKETVTENTGYLSEIFSSVQGEGVYLGVRQIFLRFAGCNLSCWYCDTPASRVNRLDSCAVQSSPHLRSSRNVPNPLDVNAVASAVSELESAAPGHHSVSLTGGEPLEQADFLLALCPKLKESGARIYLESNGTLPGVLKSLLPFIDIIAMDFKIRSATGVQPNTEAHRDFLSAAAEKSVFVKAVVSSSTHEAEIEACAETIARVGKHIPLVIQPVTPVVDGVDKPRGFQLMQFHAAAGRLLDDVRVIPQCHKVMGLL